MSTTLELNLQPGIVTAMFFILFDLIMLSLFDVILAKTVCILYYYRINKGKALSVTSADIPGVTTCLVGSFLDPTNIIAILVKLGLLIIVFNVNIDTRTSFSSMRLTSTFNFNSSEAAFPPDAFKVVERRKGDASACRQNTDAGVIFYRQGFNLSLSENQTSPETEIVPLSDEDIQLYLIDGSTLTCMSPDFVPNFQPLLEVKGCSAYARGDCSVESVRSFVTDGDVIGTTDSDSFDASNSPSDPQTFFPFKTFNQEQARDVWGVVGGDDIDSAVCVKIDAGLPLSRSSLTLCTVLSKIGNDTLLELWESTKIVDDVGFNMTQKMPGPLLKGQYDIGRSLCLILLKQAYSIKDYDWRSVAALLLVEGLLYSRYNLITVKSVSSRIVTEVPLISLGIAFGVFGLVVIFLIAVFLMTGHDKRPKINTIDGLSSILREEFNPTGSSYTTGRTSVIGLFDSPTETRSIRENEEAVYVSSLRNRPGRTRPAKNANP